jgi:uncharacterized protein with FMN-binding domain
VKRAPWYIVAGAVAGFASVLGLHRPATAGGRPVVGAAAGGQPSASPPAAGATPSQAPAAAPAGRHATATGAVERYGYGELSVKVSVTGSEITAVSVPLLRTAEPYSQQIADQVLPMLKSEVLTTHSAAGVQAISGATYTSEAYAASLQSALDKLHVR